MNGTVFTVIFVVGLAGSLFSLSLIGLAVFLSVRDVWVAHRICRQMGRVRVAADREWEHDEALGRTLEQIQSLPIANPWSVL